MDKIRETIRERQSDSNKEEEEEKKEKKEKKENRNRLCIRDGGFKKMG